MKKSAILFSAGEYLDSQTFPKPILDLSGVKYDVVAMEERLQQIGFEVTKKENANKADYIPTLQRCAEKSPEDAIHIVYFTGHGGHSNGRNYIYPSDFAIQYDSTKNLDIAGINIEDIISVFKSKGRLILILDACRTDFGISKGYFSEMASAENVYIAYGTMFECSSTGISNDLSWFTEAICDEILTANIDVDTLFMQVRQNIFIKHSIQIPSSVNTLLDRVILHSELNYEDIDEKVYNFVKKYEAEYEDKFGYFRGEHLIFIDAAQYFDIGLLDAFWSFTKVQNKLSEEMGIKMPVVTEAEQKIIDFLNLPISPKRFSYDISHTWYYNGRQIRMGEIPPLPPSMQRKLPEQGKEFYVTIRAKKENGNIVVKTNLPEHCKILMKHDKTNFFQEYTVLNGEVIIKDANDISKIIIDSTIHSSDTSIQEIVGEKSRNLVGEVIEYHPVYGNRIKCKFEF